MLSVSVYKIRYIYKHNTHPRTNDTCSPRYTRTCATPQSRQSINSHRLLLLTTSVSEATASTHPPRTDAVPSETIYSAVNAQDIQFNQWLQVAAAAANITLHAHRIARQLAVAYITSTYPFYSILLVRTWHQAVNVTWLVIRVMTDDLCEQWQSVTILT